MLSAWTSTWGPSRLLRVCFDESREVEAGEKRADPNRDRLRQLSTAAHAPDENINNQRVAQQRGSVCTALFLRAYVFVAPEAADVKESLPTSTLFGLVVFILVILEDVTSSLNGCHFFPTTERFCLVYVIILYYFTWVKCLLNSNTFNWL